MRLGVMHVGVVKMRFGRSHRINEYKEARANLVSLNQLGQVARTCAPKGHHEIPKQTPMGSQPRFHLPKKNYHKGKKKEGTNKVLPSLGHRQRQSRGVSPTKTIPRPLKGTYSSAD